MQDELELEESGHEFELRGLSLARALHDPMGSQGAVMFGGSERDGLFVGHEDIHAYEFTLARSKEKALKDGGKLSEILKAVGKKPGNTLKTRTGWFVTREEPTADQRSTIETISARSGERLLAINISTLYQRICNSERYLQARDLAPFGSVDYGRKDLDARVEVRYEPESSSSPASTATELAEQLTQGRKILLTGNYGVGKSHALREVYRELRKKHFRHKKLTPFPLHINLRDCAGLKTPAEILRRHAEEIGFDNPSSLISAWRAGACVLLLDGFDEIVPSRWFGSVSDLRDIRWQALSPLRRIIDEAPAKTGVLVAGRSHYFSGYKEMVEALGFRAHEQYTVPDFSDSQLRDFTSQVGLSGLVPEWVPARPLLLGYLASSALEDVAGDAASVTRPAGWRMFIDAICEREAKMFSGVRPETIRGILSRVATLARSRADVTGPVDMEMMRSAYTAVNGFHPDEEGTQLLMRLPGLAAANPDDEAEARVFVDRDLADAAYGLDLAAYIQDPYAESHPLHSVASWATAASDLGVEVASDSLFISGTTPGSIHSAIVYRSRAGGFDAVMADVTRVIADSDPGGELQKSEPFFITGVYFERIVLNDHPLLGGCTYADCVIETLDISEVTKDSPLPHFERCTMGLLEGAAAIPDWLTPHLSACDIDRFGIGTQTTAGIMQLNVDRETKIALTIFKKVFGQRGSARKEGALSRGLPLDSRPLVPKVVDQLIAQGWLTRATSGNTALYAGVKARRADALRALNSPGDFKL